MKLQSIKKSIILSTSVFMATTVLMTTANAEIITLKFKGVVTTVDDKIRRDNISESVSGFKDSKAFSPGDKFQGTYKYDSNTVNQSTTEGFDYSGAISSMTFTSNNKSMAVATGGDILFQPYNNNNDAFGYQADFSGVSGGDIEYRDSAAYPSGELYTPIKLELFWGFPTDVSFLISAPDLENPYFDSSKAWLDENEWSIPAPNYGDIQVTYSQVSGSAEAVMSGRLYSVQRIRSSSPPRRCFWFQGRRICY